MKGQISMELIMGAIVLLIVLTLIIFYVSEKNLDIERMENYLKSKSECREIADIISSVYASGKKTTIEFYSEQDFNVGSQWVDVDGFLCSYYAIAEQKYISKGNVRIKDLNGVVVIENY